METFNAYAFEQTDAKVLWLSFDKLKYSKTAEQVIDKRELDHYLKDLLRNISIPAGAVVSFQNLFRITTSRNHFFIGQLLLNFGFEGFGRYGTGTWNRKYDFQAIAFGESHINFGKTLMRPETVADKLVAKFFSKDISLSHADVFNAKYYLVSSAPEIVKSKISIEVAAKIGCYNDLQLFINDTKVYLTFCETLQPDQLKILEDIFCHFTFLI